MEYFLYAIGAIVVFGCIWIYATRRIVKADPAAFGGDIRL